MADDAAAPGDRAGPAGAGGLPGAAPQGRAGSGAPAAAAAARSPVPGSKPDWAAANFLSRGRAPVPGSPPALLAAGGFVGWAACAAVPAGSERRHFRGTGSPAYAEPAALVDAGCGAAAAAYHLRRSAARPGAGACRGAAACGCSAGGSCAAAAATAAAVSAEPAYRRSRKEAAQPRALDRPHRRRALSEPRHAPPRFSGKPGRAGAGEGDVCTALSL
jgi:hypothetical protein